MKTKRFLLFLCALSNALMSSCSSPMVESSRTSGASTQMHNLPKASEIHWSDNNKDPFDFNEIMPVLKKQANVMLQSNQARLEQNRHLLAFRKRADVLLELLGGENLKILNSKASIALPKDSFSIVDLQKYFPSNGTCQSNAMVLVIVPWEVAETDGKPTLVNAMREIIVTMQSNGVKKLMFQTTWQDYYTFELTFVF